MPEDLTQLGAVAIIFIFFLKEFFSYLKTKRNGMPTNYEKELALVNQKLDNHIEHICGDLDETKEEIKMIKKDVNIIQIEIVKIGSKIQGDK